MFPSYFFCFCFLNEHEELQIEGPSIKWGTITQGKDHGGLEIKRMYHMNLAFMEKLGWRLLIEVKENKLWARILATKYIRGETKLSELIKKHGSSN